MAQQFLSPPPRHHCWRARENRDSKIDGISKARIKGKINNHSKINSNGKINSLGADRTDQQRGSVDDGGDSHTLSLASTASP